MTLRLIFILVLAFYGCSRNADISHIEYYFGQILEDIVCYELDFEQNTIRQTVYSSPVAYKQRDKIDKNDTVLIPFDKYYRVEGYEMRRFLSSVPTLDSSINNTVVRLGGYGFGVFIFKSNSDSVSIINSIHERSEKDKLDFEYLDAFFELAKKNIGGNEGRQILNGNWELYEPCFLEIKKIAISPDEYKLFGNYCGSATDSQKLADFINKLPTEKPVIINPNQENFGYLLNLILEKKDSIEHIYCHGIQYAIRLKNIVEKYEKDSFFGNFISESERRNYRWRKPEFNVLDSLNFTFRSREEILQTLSNKKAN